LFDQVALVTVAGLKSDRATLKIELPRLSKAFTLVGLILETKDVDTQAYLLTVFEMLPTVPKLLLLTIFVMPLVAAAIAMIGAAAERRSLY
jgi:hypothetical protein